MACQEWTERVVGRLYGELDPSEDAVLDAHLAACPRCRESLERLDGARRILAEFPPDVPAMPRVVVLGGPSRSRRALAFAAGFLVAALLAGGGWTAGRLTSSPTVEPAEPIAAAPAVAVDEDEIATRVLSRLETRDAPEPLTREALEAALDRYDRQVNRRRAADVEYLLGEIAASERRMGTSLGRTNQALQYVALKSDPRIVQR